MNRINMGSTISNLRKEKNMTQAELANKLNVTDKIGRASCRERV